MGSASPYLGPPPVAQLYEALAADPDFFVKVMEVTWRASDAEPEEDDEQDDDATPEDEPLTEEQMQQAETGFMLPDILRPAPRHQPGRASGCCDAGALGNPCPRTRCRVRTAQSRRGTRRADPRQHRADDETWPGRPVRDLLEELQSERVERNLAVRLYNRRGMTVRDPEDGGKQERMLAEQYRSQATTFSDSWLQTAAVLRNLSSM